MSADSLRKVCSQPFVTLDQDGLVTDNNQQFSLLTGISPDGPVCRLTNFR